MYEDRFLEDENFCGGKLTSLATRPLYASLGERSNLKTAVDDNIALTKL